MYDERLAVGSANPTVVGRCICCGNAHDDYSPRFRCQSCRLLLLVCPACTPHEPCGGSRTQAPSAAASAQEQLQHDSSVPEHMQAPRVELLCSLCRAAGERTSSHHLAEPLSQNQCEPATSPVPLDFNAARSNALKSPSPACQGTALADARDGRRRPRLRILCLHGFRQSAKQFHGRTHALRKRLKDVAEFVFVDAPHVLQCYYKPRDRHASTAGASAGHPTLQAAPTAAESQDAATGSQGSASCGDLDRETLCSSEQAPGKSHAARPDSRSATHPKDLQFKNSKPTQQMREARCQAPEGPATDAPLVSGSRKRAWLLSPADLRDLVPDHDANQPPSISAASGNGCEQLQPPQPAPPSLQLSLQQQQQPQQPLPAPSLQPQPQQQQQNEWLQAPEHVGDQQQLHQTEGWEQSLAALQSYMQVQGPFDGLLGFSQGAAVAAALCALQQQATKDGGSSKSQVRRGRSGAFLLVTRLCLACCATCLAASSHADALSSFLFFETLDSIFYAATPILGIEP